MSERLYFGGKLWKEWKFQEAKEQFVVNHGDDAEVHFKSTLRSIVNDPNSLKGCKTRASDWLSNFERYYAVKNTSSRSSRKKKASQEPSSSAATPSTQTSLEQGSSLSIVNHNNGDGMIINQANSITQNSLPHDTNTVGQDETEITIPDSQSSVSTTDEQPNRSTRTLVDSNSDDIDIQWEFESLDVGAFLNQFRQRSLVYNQSKLHRELTRARILAMNHIYYFPKDKENSCITCMNTDDIEKVYAQLRTDNITLPVDVLTWAGAVQDAIDLHDRFNLEKTFGQTLIKATEHKQERLLDCVHAMIDTTRMLLSHKPVLKGSEDTFVHFSVAPLLNNTFYGDHLGSYWANKQLSYPPSTPTTEMSPVQSSSSSPTTEKSPEQSSSSSPTTEKSLSSKSSKLSKKRPDFTTYTSFRGNRYDLFVMEVKPPQSTLGEDDFLKLAKEMMAMLNRLAALRMHGPTVYGMWIDGSTVTTLSMDLKSDGLYRLVELDTFELLKTVDDLTKIKTIMQKLFKVKDGIDSIAAGLVGFLKRRKSHDRESSPSITDWTRDPFPAKRIKKTKKNLA